MSAPDFEDEPSTKEPRVRKKGPPRYATRLNPGPGLDIDHAPFSKTDVDALILRVGIPLVSGLTVAGVTKRLNLHASSYKFRVELDRQPTDRKLIAELTGLQQIARDLQAKLPILNVTGDPQGKEFAPAPAHGLVWPLRHHLEAAMADRAAQCRRETAHSIQRNGNWILEEDPSLTEEAVFGASTAADLLTNLSEGAGALAAACADAISEAEQRCIDDEVAGETPMATALRDTVHDLLGLYAQLFGRKATISKDAITGQPIGPALRFVQAALQIVCVETSDENILRISKLKRGTLSASNGPAG